MPLHQNATSQQFSPIEDQHLLSALNELSRSINISATYGASHPAFQTAAATTEAALQELFTKRSKVVIGAFNATLTVDEVPVKATGTLLKSLERRLARLLITGLQIKRGITKSELTQLVEVLSAKEASEFRAGMSQANLENITSNDVEFRAVRDDQTIADSGDLSGMGGNGVHVLEFDAPPEDAEASEPEGGARVEQIVAFLKGDVELSDSEGAGDELKELASDPARLGKMIMESVAIRQSVSDLSGESLGDIVLGCLRRTYNGLRQQPSFQTTSGKADLQKALLMLEESVLEQMRSFAGEADPELDREIVQAMREMDENIGFEIAATRYMESKEAIAKDRQELQAFIQSKGAPAAADLIAGSDFPAADWRRIVVESENNNAVQPPIEAGLSTLTTVFERLELLMKSDATDGAKVKDLLGEASENLDDTIYTTKEKLDVLSKQLKDGDPGTIGGHGRNMKQDELLAALSEVAQELMQPLTAINASHEMMLQGYVGDVTVEQRDLLSLAANSGEHLKYLMKELINIVGCPTNKGVDARYHTTSDEVVQLKAAEGREALSFLQ